MMSASARIKAGLRVYSTIGIEGLIHSSEADFFAGAPGESLHASEQEASTPHEPGTESILGRF